MEAPKTIDFVRKRLRGTSGDNVVFVDDLVERVVGDAVELPEK